MSIEVFMVVAVAADERHSAVEPHNPDAFQDIMTLVENHVWLVTSSRGKARSVYEDFSGKQYGAADTPGFETLLVSRLDALCGWMDVPAWEQVRTWPTRLSFADD